MRRLKIGRGGCVGVIMEKKKAIEGEKERARGTQREVMKGGRS